MRYYLDFYKLEDLKIKAQMLEATTQDMRSRMESIKNSIMSSNSGEAINKFEAIMELQNVAMQALENDLNTTYTKIEYYTNGLHDKDFENVVGKNYEIETDDIRKQINDIRNIIGDTEYTAKDYKLENFEDSYYNKRNEYNRVDSSINIPEEYKEDIPTQQYIRQRQNEIEQNISNQKQNRQIYEESITLLGKLEW